MYSADFFDLNPITAYPYFIPFHTPFITLLLSFCLAIVSNQPKKTFTYISTGIISHIILDLLQKGNSLLLLMYPINYEQMSLGLFWQEDWVGLGLSISSILILLVFLLRYNYKKSTISFDFSNRNNVALAFILVLLIFVIPLLTENALLNKSAYFELVQNQNSKNDEIVDLSYLPVVIINNTPYVKIYRQYFEIITEKNLVTGDLISIKGIYTSEKIKILYIHKHNIFLKQVLSLVGLILFIIILIKFNMRYSQTSI